MKVKYKGPLPKAVIPRVGVFIRGKEVEVSEELGKRLLSTGSFIQVIVLEPKKMPPKTKTWASKKPTETTVPPEVAKPPVTTEPPEIESLEAEPAREEE